MAGQVQTPDPSFRGLRNNGPCTHGVRITGCGQDRRKGRARDSGSLYWLQTLRSSNSAGHCGHSSCSQEVPRPRRGKAHLRRQRRLYQSSRARNEASGRVERSRNTSDQPKGGNNCERGIEWNTSCTHWCWAPSGVLAVRS